MNAVQKREMKRERERERERRERERYCGHITLTNMYVHKYI